MVGASTVLLIGLAVPLLYWSLLDHFRREDAAYVVDKIAVIEHRPGPQRPPGRAARILGGERSAGAQALAHLSAHH